MRSLLGSAGAFTALGGNPSVADGGARDPGAACALLAVMMSVRKRKDGRIRHNAVRISTNRSKLSNTY